MNGHTRNEASSLENLLGLKITTYPWLKTYIRAISKDVVEFKFMEN